MSNKTVLSIFGSNIEKLGACEIYRITIPLQALEENSSNWSTGWMNMSEIPKLIENKTADDIVLGHSIIVLPRQSVDLSIEENREKAKKLINIFQSTGSKVVYEVDDDFTNVHRKVPGGGENAMYIASLCDAITVTTPYLGRLMTNTTGRPSFVLPNCIDYEFWNDGKVERKDDHIIIGLTGSSTHYDDWIVLKDTIPKILKKYPNVKLLLGNFFPDYFDDLPENQVIRQPGVTYPEYRFIIRATDIILAPLCDKDGFNLSKSPIKVLEGMAARRELSNKKFGGSLCIATDHPVYRGAIQNNKNGILVSQSPKSWERALSAAIENESLRLKVQERSHQWVRKNYSIKNRWVDWSRTYNTIINRKG